MAQITFCSIVLNEEQFLEHSLRQHYAHCDRWILVEGADWLWPSEFKTDNGLSVDRTAEIIRNFPDPDKKLTFIQAGHCQNKMELRNHYASRLADDLVVIIDIDEFLPDASMKYLLFEMRNATSPAAYRIPIVHLVNTPHQFMTGGYWSVAHNRAYKWAPGARYQDNHNHPRTLAGHNLHDLMLYRVERHPYEVEGGWTYHTPMFIHYGALKKQYDISKKNEYYVNRGEATTRPRTTADRAALLTGQHQNDVLIRPWSGPWPEVLPNGSMP